jgi:hypothetical protein
MTIHECGNCRFFVTIQCEANIWHGGGLLSEVFKRAIERYPRGAMSPEDPGLDNGGCNTMNSRYMTRSTCYIQPVTATSFSAYREEGVLYFLMSACKPCFIV